jgi:hypothetical protein
MSLIEFKVVIGFASVFGFGSLAHRARENFGFNFGFVFGFDFGSLDHRERETFGNFGFGLRI